MRGPLTHTMPLKGDHFPCGALARFATWARFTANVERVTCEACKRYARAHPPHDTLPPTVFVPCADVK